MLYDTQDLIHLLVADGPELRALADALKEAKRKIQSGRDVTERRGSP